jgi:class 3 adenylate cyclase/tetratricopeptide (TPR) repeat protein
VSATTFGTPVGQAVDQAVDLAPFVPRLVVDWARREPDARHRTVDGTMLSADISGFTRLSEKLADLGKRGAEELNTVINDCFDGMIDVAAGLGGDVLKFGGDALLLLFTGPDHAGRAAHSAVGMRATINRPITTPTGERVRLRMSQGMHSGAFTFFLVDGGHRELIVTGPGATATVRCEADAAAGEILLSPATAALVPEDWLSERAPSGWLLKRRLPPGTRYVDVSDTGVAVDLRPFIPSQQIERAELDGEHRHATVAFVDFSHTDALLERGDVDGLADRLDELAGRVGDATARYGVHWLASDVYADGGKVLLTAGAPTTAGDDEERMLRAVREILDRVDGLVLRAGVNCGRIFAGHLGSRRRRNYTTMGDATNLAARLMQKAQDGELVASRAVLDAAKVRCSVRPLEPFFVKGKLIPIHAGVVEAVGDPLDRAGASTLRLVGREDELATLERALAAAADGRDSTVDLVGDHGAGKSRLVEALAKRHPDVPMLSATCGRYARETPYFAARALLRAVTGIPADEAPDRAGDALRDVVRRVAADLEPLLPLLAVPFDATAPPTPEADAVAPAFRRARAHELVLRLLDTVLPPHGALVVDEAQWLDDASRALVVDLARNAGRRGWMVCAARTPGPSPFEAVPHTAIVLGPLDERAAVELAAAAAEHHEHLRPRDVQVLAARGAGNPLFTLELVAAAAGSGSVDALPQSIETAVTARIDVLPISHRTLLREAAVMGARVDLDVLAAVTGDPAVTAAATWQPVDDFVEWHGDHVRFRHALFQEVAYEGLPYVRRRAVHHRVGEALEQSAGFRAEEESELLSLHFHHAEDHARAWRYSVMAGDDARAKFANAEAREFYERALRHTAHPGAAPATVGAVHDALGDVCELDGNYERARAAYRAARQFVAGDAELAHLLRKQGTLCERDGRYTAALRWYGRALRLCTAEATSSLVARAQLAIAYAGVRYRQARYRECIQWAERALDDAERADDARAIGHACYLLGLARIPLRDADATHWLSKAETIFRGAGDLVGLANTLNNLGMEAYFAGQWRDALDWYEQSRDARERAGDVVGAAMSLSNIGEILSDQGHHDSAEQLLHDALRIWRRAGYRAGVAFATGNLGRLAARRGRGDDALELLDAAIAQFEELDAAGFVTEMRARRAEALLLAGRDAEAMAALDQLIAADDDAEPALTAALLRLRGAAKARVGDNSAAAHDLAASARIADASALRFELAQTLLVTARLLGDADAAATAARLFTQLDVVDPVVP